MECDHKVRMSGILSLMMLRMSLFCLHLGSHHRVSFLTLLVIGGYLCLTLMDIDNLKAVSNHCMGLPWWSGHR